VTFVNKREYVAFANKDLPLYQEEIIVHVFNVVQIVQPVKLKVAKIIQIRPLSVHFVTIITS
jgi:hypothetical protein